MFHYVVVCSFSFGVSWIFCVFLLISNHLQMFSATTASARKDKFTADTRATMPMPVDLVRPIIYTFTKQIFIIICLISTLNCQGRPIAMAAWKVRQINEDTSEQKYVISIIPPCIISGEYCHCDYCRCKHGYGLSKVHRGQCLF